MKTKFLIFIFFIYIHHSASLAFRPVTADSGMIVSADRHASKVGIEILKRGGNAVDAAIAVAFTLAVTYPTAGNIGGGGFMVIRLSDGSAFALDYRETAPESATMNMYLDENGNVVKNASLLGHKACAVPGTVYGMWEAHKKFGSLSWAEIIDPAVKYALDGYLLDEYACRSINSFTEEFNKFPASRNIFTKDGEPFEVNDRLIQSDLARTLELIKTRNIAGFYSGPVASAIAEDMQRNGGHITETDLFKYRALWRKPIRFTYHGYDFYSMPLPSSGGIILGQILKLAEPFDLYEMGHNSARMIHILTEFERHVYANRALLLGDSDFITVNVDRLHSPAYLDSIRSMLPEDRAGNSKEISARMPFPSVEHLETTHFSVVDHWGNAVSNTYTLNGSYGSKVVIPGTGILMNNEMDDFSVKPGFPNSYGLVGTTANAIEPRKRMLSSMTPTIIARNDSLKMVIGSPGGSKIITSVAQVAINLIDFGMNIRDAIEAPRFHHQWFPDVIFMEDGKFNNDSIGILEKMGYSINFTTGYGFVQGIHLTEDGLTGWSDPRSNGHVSGY